MGRILVCRSLSGALEDHPWVLWVGYDVLWPSHVLFVAFVILLLWKHQTLHLNLGLVTSETCWTQGMSSRKERGAEVLPQEKPDAHCQDERVNFNTCVCTIKIWIKRFPEGSR